MLLQWRRRAFFFLREVKNVCAKECKSFRRLSSLFYDHFETIKHGNFFLFRAQVAKFSWNFVVVVNIVSSHLRWDDDKKQILWAGFAVVDVVVRDCARKITRQCRCAREILCMSTSRSANREKKYDFFFSVGISQFPSGLWTFFSLWSNIINTKTRRKILSNFLCF